MTEMVSVGSFKNMTERASAFQFLLPWSISLGVAPERRSKADATDWLRSDRRPPGHLGGLSVESITWVKSRARPWT